MPSWRGIPQTLLVDVIPSSRTMLALGKRTLHFMSAQPASARPAPKASVLGSLDAAGVPHVSLSDACRSCQLPCSEEEADGDRERFWKPLDVSKAAVKIISSAMGCVCLSCGC